MLPNVHEQCQFGVNYNSFPWCRHDRNFKFKINYENAFLNYIQTDKYWCIFAVETSECLHCLGKRDTYTNSIINDVFVKPKMNQIIRHMQ